MEKMEKTCRHPVWHMAAHSTARRVSREWPSAELRAPGNCLARGNSNLRPTDKPPTAGGRTNKHTSCKAKERTKQGLPFCAQPIHGAVSGADCAVLPLGERDVEITQCKCSLGTIHAIWGCPIRFIKVFGICPGFLPDGRRASAQWRGDSLTRAAKDAWVTLIEDEQIPMPRTSSGPLNPPDFARLCLATGGGLPAPPTGELVLATGGDMPPATR
jgi:hypothetical protein